MERVDGGQLGRTAPAPNKYKYKYKCKYKYLRDINLRYRYLRHRTLRGVDVGNLPNEYFRDRTLKGVDGANLGAQVLLYPDRNIYKSYGMANLNMGLALLDIKLWRNVSTQDI